MCVCRAFSEPAAAKCPPQNGNVSVTFISIFLSLFCCLCFFSLLKTHIHNFFYVDIHIYTTTLTLTSAIAIRYALSLSFSHEKALDCEASALQESVLTTNLPFG